MEHSFSDFQKFAVDEDVSWFETKLFDYPALRYEVNMKFIFKEEMCCPVVNFFSNLPARFERTPSFFFGNNRCLLKSAIDGVVFWTKGSIFILPNNTKGYGNCELTSGDYICNISSVLLDYEPKIRWLTFGYPCGEQKNLLRFQYEFNVTMKNTTQCELQQMPENIDDDFYFQCNRFYKYTTFPNVFGHRSQEEVYRILQTIHLVIQNLDHSCHKHFDYMLCQAFFPRCPDGTNETNKVVSHLNVICEQMCQEAVDACFTALQLNINFIDCNYYINSSNMNCTYIPVICEPPSSIPNGQILSDENHNTTYPLGSTVKYSCDTDYKIKGNNTSACQYSGRWSHVQCESTKHIKYIIIATVSGTCLLLLTVIGIFTYKKHQLKKQRANYFENQPVKKRNREFDAFVSYTYQASIDFVKNTVQPKLEVEPNPPFKLLFHTRDFNAATLIIQNILDGIKKSNCAIVLMSQEYIDASWCREEFQVSRR